MSMNKIIITIDGPSGSGKTTLGRAISKKLGITFFSSGSIYRVITKYFLDTNSLGFENFEIIPDTQIPNNIFQPHLKTISKIKSKINFNY